MCAVCQQALQCNSERECSLSDGQKLVLGRSLDADVRIADESASRHHACLSAGPADGELALTLLDLQSTNGTEVNGRAVTGPVVLASGDVIRIGDTDIEVHTQA